jgi:hypothetical protein
MPPTSQLRKPPLGITNSWSLNDLKYPLGLVLERQV